MTPHRDTRPRGAFTLIELIVMIVVLSVLAGVAIPKYINYTAQAKSAAAHGILGNVRSAVGHFYTSQMVAGSARYPTLAEMQTFGVIMHEAIPANPYNNETAIRGDTYNSSAPPIAATAHGYCYDQAAGKFWLNSDTAGIDENEW